MKKDTNASSTRTHMGEWSSNQTLIDVMDEGGESFDVSCADMAHTSSSLVRIFEWLTFMMLSVFFLFLLSL